MNQHLAASEVYLAAGQIHSSIDSLISANEWAKAKKVASELAPDMEEKVDAAYRDFLKNQGRVGEWVLVYLDVYSV